jgi:hypothetical protein
MTWAEAIDELIEDYLDIEDDDSLPTAQNDPLRRRCVRALQDGVNWLYTTYNWSWRVAPGELEVPADGNYATLPGIFEAPGEFMAAFNSLGGEMVRADNQLIARLIAATPINGMPKYWCQVAPEPDDTVGLFESLLRIYPGLPSPGVIKIDQFMQRPPTVVDNETAIYTDPNGSSFNRIPPTLQRSVVIPFAAKKLGWMQGDARGVELQDKIVDALARAWREDVVQNVTRRGTRYGRSGR